MRRNEKVKDNKEMALLKVETFTEESKLKNEIKESLEEEPPVKRKRGRPLSLEKKCSPPKKVVKKALLIKKASPEVVSVEKRPRGRPRKVVKPPIIDNTPAKLSRTKVKILKENGISDGAKTTKHASPLKTKSPVKENEVDENITSTTERLKDPDVVEDETVSSSCQDLVRSVKVQTKPISKKPPKSYINKVSFTFLIFSVNNIAKFCYRFELKWKMRNVKPLNN